jgi:hypothetical protein
MESSGLNREVLNNGNLMAWIANYMRSDVLGCIASLQNVSGVNIGQNGTLGGGSLWYSSHNNVNQTYHPPGSWLCLGWCNNGGVATWVRYA